MQRNTNYKAVGTSLPIALLSRIDIERGDVSRSRFILRLLENALKQKTTGGAGY
jgi:hypothetical protein